MAIENFKRSPPAVFKIDLVVSARTTAAQLEALRRRLDGYLASQPLAWKPTCFIRCGGLRDQSLLLSVWCSSHHVWQAAAPLFRASFLLHLALVEYLGECDISFRAADQSLRVEGAIAATLVPGEGTLVPMATAAGGAAGGALGGSPTRGRSGGAASGIDGDDSARGRPFKLQLPPSPAGDRSREPAQAAPVPAPATAPAAPAPGPVAEPALSLAQMGALLAQMQQQYQAMAAAAAAAGSAAPASAAATAAQG